MYLWCKTSKQQYVKFYDGVPCSAINKPAILSQKQQVTSCFFAVKLHTLDRCPCWR